MLMSSGLGYFYLTGKSKVMKTGALLHGDLIFMSGFMSH